MAILVNSLHLSTCDRDEAARFAEYHYAMRTLYHWEKKSFANATRDADGLRFDPETTRLLGEARAYVNETVLKVPDLDLVGIGAGTDMSTTSLEEARLYEEYHQAVQREYQAEGAIYEAATMDSNDDLVVSDTKILGDLAKAREDMRKYAKELYQTYGAELPGYGKDERLMERVAAGQEIGL